MSLRRKVLIRIIALLQGKTLIETKSRLLKCLKRHYSTVRSIRNVAVPTLGDLQMPGGEGGGDWAQLDLSVDRCIKRCACCVCFGKRGKVVS